MKIQPFTSEQWMTDFEHQAACNLTDSSVQPVCLDELLALDVDALRHLYLDYGDIIGHPHLRQEILSLYTHRDPAGLTVTLGAIQGNELVMNVLLQPEDHVITFSPGYQQLWDYPAWLKARVSVIPYRTGDWSVDLEAVRKAIRPDTRMILLANPANPTGRSLQMDELQGLVSLARQHDLWILCDEVYRMPDGPVPSISDLYDKGITTASLSKLFGLAGLRFGWIKASPDLIAQIDLFRDYSFISCGPLIERLALVALRHKDHLLGRARRHIAANQAVVQSWLKDNPYFRAHLSKDTTIALLELPQGVQSEPFARALLEETGIFFVPGIHFGQEGTVRLGLGQAHENLSGVLEKLSAFMKLYLQRI